MIIERNAFTSDRLRLSLGDLIRLLLGRVLRVSGMSMAAYRMPPCDCPACVEKRGAKR